MELALSSYYKKLKYSKVKLFVMGCKMYYDLSSGYYVNSKGIRFPKAEIVNVLRNFGEDRFFDEYGRLLICLNSDFSAFYDAYDNRSSLSNFLKRINRLRARKLITLEVRLGIVFLATELYPYTGDDDNILLDFGIALSVYDLHKKDHKILRQLLEMLTMLGYNIRNDKYFFARFYDQNAFWLSEYEVGAIKIIFWEMFALGLDIEMRNSTKFIRECYVEYVKELTLFNLMQQAIKN